MDDLELMKRAKIFIDKMANGIDPLTDKPVPETDMVNNVRVARCLFYVSDVLRKVIENGVEQKPIAKLKKGGKKKPFWLSLDDLNAFAFSETPIPISEIGKRLNGLKRDEEMKNLSTKRLTEWLIASGMLEVYTNNAGKEVKHPSEQGLLIGISSETRTGPYGTYSVVLYNHEAQQFILDNFDSILETHTSGNM